MSLNDADNADEFEQAVGDTTTAGVKSYQIVVPSFTEKPSLLGITKLSDGTTDAPAFSDTNQATSFIRLGSPPDPTSEWDSGLFAKSAQLARLVGDPNVIKAAENIKLSTASIRSDSPVDDSNASTLAAAGSHAFSDNFTDGAGNASITNGDGSTYGNAFNTNQDASYFPGFADDTRQRGTLPLAATANNTCPATTRISQQETPNTTQNRQVETLKLLTKGGWWDHSDGNRVTTTAGDKIEVVQGNYKLVVLGRQTVPTPPRVDSTTMDADVTQYRKDITSLAANAFITDVSGGHFQEQYPSPTPCIKTVEYVQDEKGEWTLYQDNGIGNLITKLKGRTVDLFQGTTRESYVGSDPGSITGAVNTPNTDLDPTITSKTWAQKIETYTGSENKPVPAIHSYTYAVEIQNYTFAASHINTTMGANAVSISGVANTLEVVMGIKESIQVGASANIQIGASFTLKLAAEMVVGATRTSVWGPSVSLSDGVVQANVQESQLTGLFTKIAAKETQIAATYTDIRSNAIDVNMGRTVLAAQHNTLAGIYLAGI